MESKIILPLPTDTLLKEKEKIWRVILPEDYKDFIKKKTA